MTSGACAAQKATESAIIRRFSSSETPSTSRTCRSQLLPTIVIAGAFALDQGLHPVIVLGGDVAATGHSEGGDLGVLQFQIADVRESKPRPWGWKADSLPRYSQIPTSSSRVVMSSLS